MSSMSSMSAMSTHFFLSNFRNQGGDVLCRIFLLPEEHMFFGTMCRCPAMRGLPPKCSTRWDVLDVRDVLDVHVFFFVATIRYQLELFVLWIPP